ncbi:Putative uncharacterized protein [Moritella viscosa]|uniref:Uncharacterized protein n=1 Tax=Moritella viscosa TaxID=80854 RepID=A0A1L0AJM5_9GAMM|nr:Putative uncharacterized protein [Moritella viscosa]
MVKIMEDYNNFGAFTKLKYVFENSDDVMLLNNLWELGYT